MMLVAEPVVAVWLAEVDDEDDLEDELEDVPDALKLIFKV